MTLYRYEYDISYVMEELFFLIPTRYFSIVTRQSDDTDIIVSEDIDGEDDGFSFEHRKTELT